MKTVHMSDEQFRALDELAIPLVMRTGDTEAAGQLMALALEFKFTEAPKPQLPSNVYPIVKHAGDSWSRKVGA